jgi:hypothetical protein
MHMRTIALGLVAAGVLAGSPVTGQQHTLDDVLARAAEYHTEYTTKISGVSLEEQTRLMDVSGGVTRGIVRISSDVVFANVSGDVAALRDTFAIDTRPTRERTPRILQLLGAPATPSIQDWLIARAFPGEQKVYFLLDIVIKCNEPTSALQFIAAANQPGLKYRLDGRKKMNGVDVLGVRFEEPQARDRIYLLGTRGNARATGRFWIDPVSGAIHQTELWVDSRTERTYSESAIVSVKYARHPGLGLLLPTEMNDSYEEFDGSGQAGDSVDPQARIGGRRSVQSFASYSNATFAAIDLTRLRR